MSYVREISRCIEEEDLEAEVLEYEIAREFLTDIKKKFGGRDKETVKVAELKRIEQGEKTIEEFI